MFVFSNDSLVFIFFNSYGTDTASTLLEDVDCRSSSYLVLLQCSYRSQISSYCNNDTRDAFVACCKLSNIIH